MIVLGVDTSTEIGSVGLLKDGSALSELTLNISVTHSERLLSSIDSLLTECGIGIKDVGLMAYAKGPGSFTGLRIGLATIKGLSFSSGAKIAGVSSLKVLARNAMYSSYEICPMIDARKEEVYCAKFDGSKGVLRIIGKERALSPEDALKGIRKKTLFFGTGARLYKDMIRKRLKGFAVIAPKEYDIPRGINVALLGLESYKKGVFEDLESAVPGYLRRSEAELRFK